MAKRADHFDMAVIGAGPGGYVAAIRGAQLGLSVVLFEERATLGGTCLNIGCIPSKALLDSSERYAEVKDGLQEHGIAVSGVDLNVSDMMKRKDHVVDQLTGGVTSLMKANGVTVVHERAAIAGAKQVTAGTSTYEAEHIVLATGSVPVELPFIPFDGKFIVDSTDSLAFDKVPKSLVIVGAGVIGLELGSVWLRLGSKVTVVEIMDRILPEMDKKAAVLLKKELAAQGMEFLLSTKVTGVDNKKGTVAAEDKSGNAVSIKADKVLVAVGRRANIGDEIESRQIAVENGKIVVDEHFRTSMKGVYAIGDLIAGPMLAHKAEEEGAALAELIVGKAGHVNYGAIPGVVYTLPELASVGKTEEELKAADIPYVKGEFPFRANGRALASGYAAGSVKILADKHTDEVLGAHIVGAHAADLLAEVVSVIEFAGSAEDIARTVHAHPTLTEAVKEAALSVDSRAIHTVNRKK